jgi:NADPH2:quinone reductase
VRYVTFDQPGPPGVLRVAEAANPQPGPKDVLISVEAAGVSRADALQRQGNYPPPPGASLILGLEVSGTVAALGPGAGGFAVGDRVVALCNGGGYAEYATAPAGQVLPLPDEWSFVEGATLPENAFTVYDNLFTRAHLAAGETLLVHGGTSGIGTTAIMFALASDVRVLATAGSQQKCQAILDLGAQAAFDYHSGDFVEWIRTCTSGHGADVILDIVGGDYIGRDLHAVAVDGRIVCIAMAHGADAAIDLRYLLQRRAAILGSTLRPRSPEEKAAIAAALRERIWPLLGARNPIRPVLDSVFTFSDAAQAHARLESSAHVGKIVLVPDA